MMMLNGTMMVTTMTFMMILPSTSSLKLVNHLINNLVEDVCEGLVNDTLPVPANCSCRGAFNFKTGINAFANCTTDEILCIDPPTNRWCGYPDIRTQLYRRREISQTSLQFNLTQIFGLQFIRPDPLYAYLNHTVPISLKQPLNFASCELFYGTKPCQSCGICNNGQGIVFNCSNVEVIRIGFIVYRLPEITACIQIAGENNCTSTNKTGVFGHPKNPPQVKVKCPKDKKKNKNRRVQEGTSSSIRYRSIEEIGLPTTELSSYYGIDTGLYYPNRYIDSPSYDEYYYGNDEPEYYESYSNSSTNNQNDDPYQYIHEHYNEFLNNHQHYKSALRWYNTEKQFCENFEE